MDDYTAGGRISAERHRRPSGFGYGEGLSMLPADDKNGESFRGLVLQLRGRTGLTQRELATRVGVNISSIQGWEAGANYPGVASLKALIAIGLQADAFTTGRETEEARALWW